MFNSRLMKQKRWNYFYFFLLLILLDKMTIKNIALVLKKFFGGGYICDHKIISCIFYQNKNIKIKSLVIL